MEEKIKRAFNMVFALAVINNPKKKEKNYRKGNKVMKYSISPI